MLMMTNLEKEELLIQLAQDYYVKNIPITELTKTYGISRYKILKHLEEANDTGVVTITINSPFQRNKELEAYFKQHFTTDVLVLKNTENIIEEETLFWEFCSTVIQEAIEDTKIVSLSWGDSVYKIIEQFKPSIKEDITFAQFLGESGKYQTLAGSLRLVQKAANKYEGDYLTLTAPLYILDPSVRTKLALEPGISTTLSLAKRSDLLLTSLATPASITSVDAWNQNKELIFGPTFDQAIGMAYGRPFNLAGEFLIDDLDKTFGLSLDDIFAIPKRIAISNSKFKAEACLGALNGEFFTQLIVDEKTALKITQFYKRQKQASLQQ